MILVGWTELKIFANDRGTPLFYVDFGDYYLIKANDTNFEIHAEITKSDPSNSDQTDFEANYKPTANPQILDSDGNIKSRLKIARSGWTISFVYVELETSNMNILHCKDESGNDLTGVSVKLYDSDSVLINDQTTANTDCVKTVFDFEPTYNYEIMGGHLYQLEVPSVDVRLFTIGIPDIASPLGSKPMITGGMNLKYLNSCSLEIDGRSPKELQYSDTYHTNKLRNTFKHPAGHKHKMLFNFTIYRE